MRRWMATSVHVVNIMCAAVASAWFAKLSIKTGNTETTDQIRLPATQKLTNYTVKLNVDFTLTNLETDYLTIAK